MSTLQATIGLSGRLSTQVKTKRQRDRDHRRLARWWHIKNWVRYRWREIPFTLFVLLILPALRLFLPALTVLHGRLRLRVLRANGDVIDYGTVGRHLIVTAGKGFVVDAWQNLVELENMKFHGLGEGTTAANVADTALETELSTEYNPNSTRATGTTAEASATVFRTVGTNTVDGAATVTEWGLLSQAATGGGVLFDRQVFSAVNLGSGDSLQTTYDLTVG